jgi:hypothetical protein
MLRGSRCTSRVGSSCHSYGGVQREQPCRGPTYPDVQAGFTCTHEVYPDKPGDEKVMTDLLLRTYTAGEVHRANNASEARQGRCQTCTE